MANANKMVNGQLIQMTDAEQKEFDDKNTAYVNATPARRMVDLRKQRDKLLAETDWMGNQDYSITDAWKTYRQALRDITDQTPSDNALSNITWPTKPS